jgi:hypothetical protein
VSEIEKLIFAAAYALELGKRMDAAVNEVKVSARSAISFAHAAVALYRSQRQEQDP